jgi:polyferredoxin
LDRKTVVRKVIQAGWGILTNSHLVGFLEGNIYKGSLKNICVPGLNCYSCPGSLGSCPIGALQAVLGSPVHKFSFYLSGFFLVAGTFLGRLVCGFLCPFGLIQELLNKIPFPQKICSFCFDKYLRYVKYAILLIFVILLPLFAVDVVGGGQPWFCKWICPAGTLEGGIPLVLLNRALQNTLGFLYAWKMAILIAIIVLSIIIYRPFCKYFCPLGAIYALFNRIAIYKYWIDEDKCVNCMECEKACPMQARPRTHANHGECIRCGVCKKVCKAGAMMSGFKRGTCKIAEKSAKVLTEK